MRYLIKNGYTFEKGKFERHDVLIDNGIIIDIADNINDDTASVFNFDNCYIFPAFVDVHVHLREPGFFNKETIASGTAAAAHGGFGSVCSMPNLKPVPDSIENLNKELEIIKNDALINVYPYGAITVGQNGDTPADMSGMAESCIAFSDDGRGVQNDGIMKEAMRRAKSLGKIIAAHCEDNSLLNGGYIHDGEYAKLNGHKGICSESEWLPISRDLSLAKETGCKYHVCHISTKESVDIIRNAKQNKIDVTCETAPHYLVFNDMMLKDEGRFKMNPPIRSESDRIALIEGIKDGTIDMIATDHAPHTEQEKSGGLKNSLNGIVGLETSFPVLYTNLVKTGIITLEKLIELMFVNPSERFGIGSEISIGRSADITVFNLDEDYVIDSKDFLSKGKSSPFCGAKVFGKCKMTICAGKVVYDEK